MTQRKGGGITIIISKRYVKACAVCTGGGKFY